MSVKDIALVLAAVAVVAVVGVIMYQAGRWLEGRKHAYREPAVIDPVDVDEGFRSTAPLRLNPVTRTAPVIREGTGPALEEDDPDREAAIRYASEALEIPDTLTTPLYPPTRGFRDGDQLAVGVMGSDLRWHRKEIDCPEGRRVEWWTQDSTFGATCERALTGWLPGVAKDAAVCAGTAAVGYGLGVLTEYDHPEYVAAGAAAGCVLIKITD